MLKLLYPLLILLTIPIIVLFPIAGSILILLLLILAIITIFKIYQSQVQKQNIKRKFKKYKTGILSKMWFWKYQPKKQSKKMHNAYSCVVRKNYPLPNEVAINIHLAIQQKLKHNNIKFKLFPKGSTKEIVIEERITIVKQFLTNNKIPHINKEDGKISINTEKAKEQVKDYLKNNNVEFKQDANNKEQIIVGLKEMQFIMKPEMQNGSQFTFPNFPFNVSFESGLDGIMDLFDIVALETLLNANQNNASSPTTHTADTTKLKEPKTHKEPKEHQEKSSHHRSNSKDKAPIDISFGR